jgi:hypothetical protein
MLSLQTVPIFWLCPHAPWKHIDLYSQLARVFDFLHACLIFLSSCVSQIQSPLPRRQLHLILSFKKRNWSIHCHDCLVEHSQIDLTKCDLHILANLVERHCARLDEEPKDAKGVFKQHSTEKGGMTHRCLVVLLPFGGHAAGAGGEGQFSP